MKFGFDVLNGLHIIPCDQKVINIHKNKGVTSFRNFGKQGIITFGLTKALLQKKLCQFQISLPRGLF